MKAAFCLLCILALVPLAAGDELAPRQPCQGDTLFYGDGTYETCYTWQYGGVVSPYYGAFAEFFDEQGICALCCDFTTLTGYGGGGMDVYVWEDAGGQPGNVLALVQAVIDVTALWPNYSRSCVELPDGIPQPVWLGYWGNWPGQVASWYICADTDDVPNPGTPMTNIAPGIGYPTGWQSVDVVWGSDRRTRAIGLGAVIEGGPVPVPGSSWGTIKALFR